MNKLKCKNCGAEMETDLLPVETKELSQGAEIFECACGHIVLGYIPLNREE